MKTRKLNLLLSILCLLCAPYFWSQTKVVLIEEGTGTWCQYCPRGYTFTKIIKQNYPNTLFVGIHNFDPMDSPTDYYDSSAFSGLPAGHLDRTINNQDPVNWENAVQSLSSITPPADISVSTTFDSQARLLTITVSANFFINLTDEYRLGAIVLEDAVIGDSAAYNQMNIYSGGSLGTMGGWENLPNPVPYNQMIYDNVARKLVSDYDGDPGTLPNPIVAGTTYSSTFTWTVPPTYDEKYIYTIGYLTQVSSGQIKNAGRGPYITNSTNGLPKFVSQPITQTTVGYNYNYVIQTHDPDNSNLTITNVSNLPLGLSFSQNGSAQLPFNGSQAFITGTPFTSGFYPIDLEVTDGIDTAYQSYILEIIPSDGANWTYNGLPGFTNETADITRIEMNSQNTPYAFYYSLSDMKVHANKFVNGNWTTLGNSLPVNQYGLATAIGRNDSLFIAISNNGLRVYTLQNSTWVAIGDSLGFSMDFDLALDQNNTPYVVFSDQANNNRGICKKWDGQQWVTVGGSHFINFSVTKNKIEIDTNGIPYLLHSVVISSVPHSFVRFFENNTWNVLGGSAINPVFKTVDMHDFKIDQNNTITVAIPIENTSNMLAVYRYGPNGWTDIGFNIAQGEVKYVNLILDSQYNPIVGYKDMNIDGKSTVLQYDGNTWTPIGLVGFSNPANNQSMAIGPNDIPFIAYKDLQANGKLSVKHYQDATGLKNLEDKPSWVIYPNPSTGSIYFESSVESDFWITDLSGQLILKGKSKIGINEINLHHKKAGTYLLQIQSTQSIKSNRFILLE